MHNFLLLSMLILGVNRSWKMNQLRNRLFGPSSLISRQIGKGLKVHTAAILHQYEERLPLVDPNELVVLTKHISKIDLKEDILKSEGKLLPPRSHFSCSEFYDPLVEKFTNIMMKGGRKAVSRAVLEDTLERIKTIQLAKRKKSNEPVETDPLKIFYQAVENAKPVVTVITVKRKGGSYQVPYPLPDKRKQFIAIRWFVTISRDRATNSTPMSVKLSKELLDAYNNEGAIIQKKMDMHRRAETHRALANYRWW